MSTAKFNYWQRNDGTAVGTILQVKYTLYSTPTSQSFSATTDIAVTGITVNITPYSTASKMLIMVRWSGEVSVTAPWDGVFFITRNGTKINLQTGTSARGSGSSILLNSYQNGGSWDNNSTPDQVIFNTVDAPSTTSQITYNLACTFLNAGTLYTNRTVADTDLWAFERTTSEIIVMEIAA